LLLHSRAKVEKPHDSAQLMSSAFFAVFVTGYS
jgi:hypothetical protein